LFCTQELEPLLRIIGFDGVNKTVGRPS